MAVDGFSDPLTRHLGYRSIRHDERTASSWIEIRDDLRDRHGALHLGVLAYLVDSTAGVVCGMAAVPSWVITSDLQFRVLHRPTRGPLRADARAVQPGKRTSLGSVQVVGEGDGDRLVAIGTVNHVVIASDGSLDVPADMPIGVEYASGHTVAGHAPLLDCFGVEISAPGVARLPIEGTAVNPLGILHGGLISLLIDEAARSADTQRRLEVTDLVVRFLRGLRSSPAIATATMLPGTREGTASAIVEIRDASGTLGALAHVGLGER